MILVPPRRIKFRTAQRIVAIRVPEVEIIRVSNSESIRWESYCPIIAKVKLRIERSCCGVFIAVAEEKLKFENCTGSVISSLM